MHIGSLHTKLVFSTTVKCLRVQIVYLSFLIFAIFTLMKSTDIDYAGSAFILMSWIVSGILFTDLFFVDFSLVLLLTIFYPFYLCVLNYLFVQVPKRSGKGCSKRTWILLLLDDRGYGFQVSGLVHLLSSCFSLQDYCLADSALFNWAATGKQWSWNKFHAYCVIMVGCIWSVHSMQLLQPVQPSWHSGYWIPSHCTIEWKF